MVLWLSCTGLILVRCHKCSYILWRWATAAQKTNFKKCKAIAFLWDIPRNIYTILKCFVYREAKIKREVNPLNHCSSDLATTCSSLPTSHVTFMLAYMFNLLHVRSESACSWTWSASNQSETTCYSCSWSCGCTGRLRSCSLFVSWCP